MKHKQQRKLAAIMFTDIVGYTAFMQEDEPRARSLRDRLREVHRRVVHQYGGQILQFYGDGVLCSFQSAIEATRCAVEVQKALRRKPKVPARVGIHLGDVVIEEEGISGDGVNVASRVEQLAAAGGICISEKVYDEIKNQPGMEVRSLGSVELKNVRRPMEVFAMAGGGLAFPEVKEFERQRILKQSGLQEMVQKKKVGWFVPLSVTVGVVALVLGYFLFQPEAESGERIPIAVVDFVNETEEKELDGLSGLLTTALEQSRRLSVLTRSRMFDILKQLGKEDVDRIDETLGREICRQANVNALVIASIRKLGRLYIINLKVLDPQKNEYLFTAKEEGEGQERVSSMIDKLAEKTRVGLKEKAAEIQATSQKVAEVTTPNLAAYQHYFKGEELVGKLKWEEAKEELHWAISLDTTFALAYYRLAYAMTWTGEEGAKDPIRKAMEYIERVPEKERYLIRAWNAIIDGNTDEAIAIYQELLKLYPEEKEALFEVGGWSYHKGDYLTAIKYLEKVLAIDPTFARALNHIIWAHIDMGQYDKMLEYARQYVAKAPSEDAYNLLGEAYNLRGEFDEAFQTYGQALGLFPTSTMPIVGMGVIYIFKDEYEKAEAEFRKLLQDPRPLSDARDGYRNLAILYAYLGKYRETVKMVDKIIEIDMKLADNTGLAGSYANKAFWLVVGNNDRQQAEMAIEKGLELKHAANWYFYFPLFDTYLRMGEYENPASIAKSHLSRIFPFLDVLVRAHVHQAKGEYEEAISDYQAFIQRHGPIAKMGCGYNLAQCYFESGQSERAIEAIQRAQRIYFHSFGTGRSRAAFYPTGFYLLGKIYEKKGDQKLAIENYEKFLDLWIDADKDLPELMDAKSRLAKLKGVAVR